MSKPKSLREFGGSARRLFRFANPADKMWSAFNPSIAVNPDGEIAMLIRSSNYLLGNYQSYTSLTTGTDIQNKIYYSKLTDELLILEVKELKVEIAGELSFKRGVEDARLFWRDGQWWMLGVILEKPHTPVARMGLFSVDLEAGTASLVEKYPGIADNVVEKNWGVVAGEAVKEFDYIYSPNSVFKNGKIKKLKEPGKFKGIRGGTQLIPWDDGYLAVGHITRVIGKRLFNHMTFSVQEPKLRDYTHVFIKYKKSGEIEHVSEEFIFNTGGVEFASGLVQLDDKIYISYGYDDCEGWLASLDVKTVRTMLQ